MDSSPSVSFIGIVDFTEDACWVYCSESVYDLLGFEPRELIGRPSLELVHPDEFAQVRGIHYSTITQDQAAVLAYLRMRHKDPCKGYILCAISRTVCQNVLVGSVSYAQPGPKAMHNASTAQQVTIITPTAKDFEFHRWNDPNPMPPCPVPTHLMAGRPGSPPTAENNTYPEHFDPLPEQSVRTALFLDRFTINCTILYCSNDSIISTTHAMGRSFFDFVAKRDQELVRSWIDVIKSWGVNERGQPSDGGFGYGKFTLLVQGRDSSDGSNDIAPVSRRRSKSHRAHTATTDAAAAAASARRGDFLRELTRERPPTPQDQRARPAPLLRRAQSAELVVDAIFSAHSDGLMVILRQSSAAPASPARASSSSSSRAPPSHPSSSHAPPSITLRPSAPSSASVSPATEHDAYTFPPPLPPPPTLRPVRNFEPRESRPRGGSTGRSAASAQGCDFSR